MRGIAFIVILTLSTLLPWYVLLFFALVYMLYFESAYELIAIALLIDGYFGVATVIPYFTLAALGLLALIEWSKPRLLFYNDLS